LAQESLSNQLSKGKEEKRIMSDNIDEHIDEEPEGIEEPELAAPESNMGEVDIRRILDIPLVVSVELGRNKMQIEDLLRLAQGSVVELNKLAGEPLSVMVHGRLIARGEAVVVNDKFGVRLTDVISPEQRIEQLTED
jgi:flagellar motor switch protein FliN